MTPEITEAQRIVAAIACAQALALRGFGIVPAYAPTAEGGCSCARRADCPSPGKHPIGEDWQKGATRSPQTIAEIVGKHGHYGVIPWPGERGLILDADHPEQLPATPPTYVVLRGSERFHAYYKLPAGYDPRHIPATTPWGEVRVEGAARMVIGPYSRHASGDLYLPKDGHKIEDIPPEVLDRLFPPQAAITATNGAAKDPYHLPEPGYLGSRYEAIRQYVAHLWGKRMRDEAEVWASVRGVLAPRFAEQLSEQELRERFDRTWAKIASRLGDDASTTGQGKVANGGAVVTGARWLSEVSADPPPPRLLGRWDPKGLSIIYGGTGVGKGVQLSADIVQLVRAGYRPMIVDYEMHGDEYARRIMALGGPEVVAKVLIVTPLDREQWKGPSGPLWDIAAPLRELVVEFDRSAMIVDSLGPACMGMGMNDPETPQRVAEATVAICPLTIAIGQVNRARDLSAPFGSVFYGYWSRAMWSAERAPGHGPDNLQQILLTDRKANNYARADRILSTVAWRDGLPMEFQEQPYALALADQISEVLGMDQMTVNEIVERLNEEVDDSGAEVKADSVRKTLRRGLHSVPRPRFAVSGKGSTARWSI